MIRAKLLSIAPLFVAIPTMMCMTQVTIAQTIPSMPIEINPYTQGVAFSHLMFYLNATDNHVHFKGLVQNTLPVSVDSLSISLGFEDKATSTSVHSASWLTPFGSPPINSKQTVAFDMDTGYTKAQLNQFQYLKAMIT